MVNGEFFDVYEGNFTNLLSHDEKYTFLAGAGISMDAPTKIPSAREIVRTMLELCAPMEEIDGLLSLKMLRYEMMIEKIKNTVDKDLHFLDYLELIDEPNYIHYFLANVIVNRKDYVVTTNFDYMIEKGIQRTLEPEKHEYITPVITRDSFISNFRPLDLFKEGKYPLYKIHGSKRNLITGENTGDSLVTTMSSLGRDRGIGETFSLESYKKQAVYNLMKNRTLIVMGYSGSDDFDIGPTLQGLPYLSRLIWVEHVQDLTKKIYKVKKNHENRDIDLLSQSERILINIASRAEIEVFLVKMKTIDFVKEELWKELLHNVSLPEIIEKSTHIIPGFKEWTGEEFKNAETSDVKKYMLSCSIYRDLNHDNAIFSNAEKGLKLAKSSDDIASQSYFQNHLGLINLKKGEFKEALDYFEKSLEIAEQINNPLKKAISLSNIGQIYMRQNERKLEFKPDKAVENYNKALRLFEAQQDQWGKIVCLNNLAEASLWEGDQQQALKYLMEALFLVQQLGNLEFKATITNNIGGIISTWENLDDALKQVHDALNIRQEIGDLRGVADCFHNLGDIFFHQNEYNKALESYNKELEIRKKLGEKRALAIVLSSIG
ncbi:MAG: Tetratricopeptide repeat containig protein, partial [Candidatus Lokiarchaeum sp. GC14_75]